MYDQQAFRTQYKSWLCSQIYPHGTGVRLLRFINKNTKIIFTACLKRLRLECWTFYLNLFGSLQKMFGCDSQDGSDQYLRSFLVDDSCIDPTIPKKCKIKLFCTWLTSSLYWQTNSHFQSEWFLFKINILCSGQRGVTCAMCDCSWAPRNRCAIEPLAKMVTSSPPCIVSLEGIPVSVCSCCPAMKRL